MGVGMGMGMGVCVPWAGTPTPLGRARAVPRDAREALGEAAWVRRGLGAQWTLDSADEASRGVGATVIGSAWSEVWGTDVRVVELATGERQLQMGEALDIHSVRLPRGSAALKRAQAGARSSGCTGCYWDDLALGVSLMDVRRDPPVVGVLGLGGGTAAGLIRALYPEVQVEAWEIDAAVVELAHAFLGLPRDDPGLVVHVGDALEARARTSPQGFGALVVDLWGDEGVVPELGRPGAWAGLVRRLARPAHGRIAANIWNDAPSLDALVAGVRRPVFWKEAHGATENLSVFLGPRPESLAAWQDLGTLPPALVPHARACFLDAAGTAGTCPAAPAPPWDT